MTSDFLSQEEIDALLRQGNVEETSGAEEDKHLNDFERDALGEIGNISFGTAATALSTLLRHKVEITTPAVSIVPRNNLKNDMPLPHVVIKVDYTDGFQGANVLAIQIHDAQVIADLMLGGDGSAPQEELNELHLSAVGEAMNQMMGSAATSMSTIFNMPVNITPPNIEVLQMDDSHVITLFPSDDVLVKISFRLIVGELIDSTIMQLVPISFAKTMLAKLTGKNNAGAEQPASAADAPAAKASVPAPAQPVHIPATEAAYQQTPPPGYGTPPMQPQMPGYGTPPMQPQMQGYGMAAPQAQAYGMPMAAPPQYGMANPYVAQQTYGNNPGMNSQINVQPAQFAPFEAVDPNVISNGNLNLLLDIPLQVTVELGRTRKQIRDILELGPGSILELDKLAGEPVDILVNGKLIAKGEVVVIDENFGVRVTDILTPAERIAKLQ